ncbi:hypothetical protein PENVUL_c002G05911 [Penicillium vulpinum]|uniref:Uncharacterized protein n=1 Tax=Penicillium vulpinum TaxID=29845 RepID=A0A1V6SC13_9EURO|nr:hypothetical protein PENVUL_c002G05911 [Penicillium vulpinum]
MPRGLPTAAQLWEWNEVLLLAQKFTKSKGTAPAPGPAKEKVDNIEFLLTLLDRAQMDYKLTAQNLGIQKSAYRIRLLRLQQRYGIKKVGPTGSPHNTTQSTADDTEMSDLADLEDTNTEGATEKYDA